MICEFHFCIYNENNQCILDEISINESGICDCAIYPEIDDEYLKQCKQTELKKYGSYWRE